MVNFSMLSAVPRGYMDAQAQGARTQQQELVNQDLQLQQFGDVAAGNFIKAFQQSGWGSQLYGGGSSPASGAGYPPTPSSPPAAGPAPTSPVGMSPTEPPPGQMGERWPSMPMSAGGQRLSSAMAQPPPGTVMNPGQRPPPPPQGGPLVAQPQPQPMQGQGPQGAPPGPPQGQGGPPPGMPPGPGGQPYPGLSLPQMMQGLSQANPGAPPQVLMRALSRLAPLLNQDARLQLAEMNMQMRGQIAGMQEQGRDIRSQRSEEGKEQRLQETITGRENVAQIQADAKRYGIDTNKSIAEVKAEIERAKESGRGYRAEQKRISTENVEAAKESGRQERADLRAKTQERGQDKQAETAAARREQQQKQFETREERYKRRGNERHQEAMARIAQGDERLKALQEQRDKAQTLAQKRMAIDAMHKHILELTAIYSYNNELSLADRKALAKEINDAYNREIKNLRAP